MLQKDTVPVNQSDGDVPGSQTDGDVPVSLEDGDVHISQSPVRWCDVPVSQSDGDIPFSLSDGDITLSAWQIMMSVLASLIRSLLVSQVVTVLSASQIVVFVCVRKPDDGDCVCRHTSDLPFDHSTAV
ncbi:Hypothetical predicted protein [Mytilus galloprovincialis]|uniref:Uncharacterized protein n=1 Tax=Mytilus galloprovincialis TaxID=29158 RepID=A0A8B6CJT6_MYTGA|nr:Hypothetical predicted protein [Mytilus galloprovincialis]